MAALPDGIKSLKIDTIVSTPYQHCTERRTDGRTETHINIVCKYADGRRNDVTYFTCGKFTVRIRHAFCRQNKIRTIALCWKSRRFVLDPLRRFLSLCSDVTWRCSGSINHGEAMTVLEKVVYVYVRPKI